MSKNPVLYVLIVVAVLAATAVSLRQFMTTKAAGTQGSQRASQGLSALSAHADALNDEKLADRCYDAAGNVRSYSRGMPGFAASKQADRSYDSIEKLRAIRTPEQAVECLDGECSYQLANGQWVR